MLEIDYYRTQSGLPAGLSLQDYQLAYFRVASGLPAGLAIDDYRQKFYETQTGYKNQTDGEYWYYANQLALTNPKLALDDLRKQWLDAQ